MWVDSNSRPSVQKLVVSALSEALTVPVSTKVPKVRPPRFVTVQRTGGGMQNPVTDRALVAIQCWSNDDLDAESMCIDCEAALFAIVGVPRHGTMLRHCKEVTAPLAFPDESGQIRYQVLVEIDVVVH